MKPPINVTAAMNNNFRFYPYMRSTVSLDNNVESTNKKLRLKAKYLIRTNMCLYFFGKFRHKMKLHDSPNAYLEHAIFFFGHFMVT